MRGRQVVVIFAETSKVRPLQLAALATCSARRVRPNCTCLGAAGSPVRSMARPLKAEATKAVARVERTSSSGPSWSGGAGGGESKGEEEARKEVGKARRGGLRQSRPAGLWAAKWIGQLSGRPAGANL